MRLTSAVGMVAAYFLGWHAWSTYKASRSAAVFEADEARGSRVAGRIGLAEHTAEHVLAAGAPARALNVNNFGMAELDGGKAPHNNLR